MSYTWPIHETVRYWNVIYMTCSRYDWNNTGSLVALWPVHSACSKKFQHHAANPCSIWGVSSLWFWAFQLEVWPDHVCTAWDQYRYMMELLVERTSHLCACYWAELGTVFALCQPTLTFVSDSLSIVAVALSSSSNACTPSWNCSPG